MRQVDSLIHLGVYMLVVWKEFPLMNSFISICLLNYYRPKESFASGNKSNNFVNIKYNVTEAKRQELINTIRNTHRQLVTQVCSPNTTSKKPFNKSSSTNVFNNSANTTVSNKNRNNYDEIIRRGKEREINLMNKMLRNEEEKNNKYEQEDNKRQEEERRMKILEREHQ